VSFERPLGLVALVAVPLLLGLWLAEQRRRRAAAGSFSNPALLPNLVAARPGRLRHLPLALFLVALAALLVGVARPQASVSVPRREAVVVLAIDISRSMTAHDVAPTRFGAARAAAVGFLEKIPATYQVALVEFGTRAFVAVPPTTDRALVRAALANATPSEGTAIGDAVVLSALLGQRHRASDGTPLPASVLLLSDGARDGGRTSTGAAARRARRLHVPVSTVLLGTANGMVTVKLAGGFTERIRVPPSAGTLQALARGTGGTFFRARTSAALKAVYAKLATRLGHRTERREVTDLFAGGGIVLMLAGSALSALWFRRVP
jgi:Ca-activated chloride channel family protein